MAANDSYQIIRHEDGTCDVVMYAVRTYHHEAGIEYDYDEYVLPCVPWYDGIEDNIREHFEAWLAHAAAFTAQRAAMLEIIDRVTGWAAAAAQPAFEEGSKREC